jgi:hypothetical protein
MAPTGVELPPPLDSVSEGSGSVVVDEASVVDDPDSELEAIVDEVSSETNVVENVRPFWLVYVNSTSWSLVTVAVAHLKPTTPEG